MTSATDVQETNGVEPVDRLEVVSDSSWSAFAAAPVAVLLVAESDCPACGAWTRTLREHLRQSREWEGVRFGKIELDLPTARGFRTSNAKWLELVEGIPFNVLYVNGEPRTSFAGAGLERLKSRLRRYAPGLASPQGERGPQVCR
jgi:hypothetical protein